MSCGSYESSPELKIMWIWGGIEIDDTIEIAKALENSGVDFLHVSVGTHETICDEVAPSFGHPPFTSI